MKAKVTKTLALGSIVAGAIFSLMPLVAQADGMIEEQVQQPRRHKRVFHRSSSSSKVMERVIERPVMIEKPVYVDRIVEKQVTIEKPGEVILQTPMETERKVVVEHAARRKPLIHLGIPFIGLDLF